MIDPLSFNFHYVLQQQKAFIFINYHFERVLRSVMEYIWISNFAIWAVLLLIRKSVTEIQDSVTYVAVNFQPPCWCRSEVYQHGISIQKLYKFRLNISPNISNENCSDLKLIESLCILNVFHFPDSGLNLSNGFGFYFRWRDSDKQLYVFLKKG